MKIQFSENFDMLYIQENPNEIRGIPTKQLTEEDKEFIYNEIAKERYV